MADFTPSGISLEVQGLNKFMSGIGKADKGINSLNKSTGNVSKGFASLGKGVLNVGVVAGAAATAGIAALGAGVAAIGVTSIKTAISFESAFAGVLKTTDGLTSSIGVLNEEGKALREGFVTLSKEVPIAFEELAAIGELGGQLGVGKEALLDFTETVAALGVSTNLTTEDAASSIAQLANIYSVSASDMGLNTQQVGSTIVALGNNFATTERDIVAFGLRLAGAGNIAGLAQSEVLAIGAAMSSVGVQAEAGGTAVQKVLLAINGAVNTTSDGFIDNTKAIDKNVEKLTKLQAESARLEAQFPGLQSEIVAQRDAFIAAGGTAEEFGRQLGDKTRQKAFETATAISDLTAETQLLRDQQGQPVDPGQLAAFAKVAGVSADEFKAAWETDAAGAFQAFVEGLANEGDNAVNILNDLGLSDQRLIKSFLSLSGAGDLLGRTIDTANSAFEENTALSNEAAQRYATTESQLALLKNTLRATADTIGSALLPTFNRFLGIGKDLIDKWAGPLSDILDNSVVPAIENVMDTVGNLIDTFSQGGLFGTQDPSGGGAEGLLAALGIPPDLRTVIEDVFNTINDIILGFQEGGVGGAFGALFSSDSAGSALQGVIDFISQFLADNWPIVQAQLAEWGNMFFDWVNSSVIPSIPTVLQGVIEGLTTFLASGGPEAIRSTTQGWVDAFWEWVAAAVITGQQELANIIASIGQWALDSGTQGQLTEFGTQLGTTLVEFLISSMEDLVSNTDRFDAILIQLAGGLLIGVAAVAGILIIIGGQIVAGILEGILSALGVDFESTTFSELGAILTGIGANALTAASIIGTNIILGISQGILDTIDNLTTTLEQIGTIIVETVKNILGISSPSTIFFQFGVDIIQGLIDGIGSLLGSLGEIASEIFGSLFGGGETEAATPAVEFDPKKALAGIEQLTAATDSWNLMLTNITSVTIPLLLEMWTVTMTMITEQLLLLLNTGILPVDQALILIHSVTLPTLQAVSQTTTQLMTTGFTEVEAALQAVLAVLNQIVAALSRVATAATVAASEMENLADTDLDDLLTDLDAATSAAESLAAALALAAGAASNVSGGLASSGIGFAQGIGFRAGTPSNTGGSLGLGFKIPPGFPNDSFGPFFAQSGEEMLITPRGMSIDSLVFSRLADLIGGGQVSDRPVVTNITNNFNMTVNTGASASGVTRQFEVMRGLIGA